MYPTVHDCWKQWSKEYSQEDRDPQRGTYEGRSSSSAFGMRVIVLRLRQKFSVGTTVTERTVTNRLALRTARARRPVACIPLTQTHAVSDVSGVASIGG
ncbi:hypothetical protein AVEN_94059-1 [Araneus ventricosus]|uniref:Uncharacterized protein n=1 Tax=Araneus ventricosus TaxID=182803 RepID=A0A4Y2S6F2_ARAVE|nr:hypothetical protein AVEN_94059-1 [Araneus ventricosus]